MILMLHIVIALASMVFTAGTAIKPSRNKLRVSYGLASGTLGSGILLVVVEPKTMVQACVSGLIYFAIISVIIALTHRKLAYSEAEV